MTKISEGVNSVNKSAEFKYNAKGLRVQKKVTDGNAVTTTDYILHGRRIMHEIVTESDANGNTITKEMHFFYGEDGRPAMVKFNGNYYTYVCNLQGDIVGIVDAAGSLVVEYKYDAWGKRIEALASDECEDLEKLNPFTYRGHVWDAETGLYYMRARYYSPEYCRFISPDKIKYLGTDGNILSYNAYVYCNNNPVNMCDASGDITLLALGAAVGKWVVSCLIDLGTSYLVSRVFDAEYNWKVNIFDAAFSNILPGKKWRVAYDGLNAVYSATQAGVDFEDALLYGVVSGTVSSYGLTESVDDEIQKASMKFIPKSGIRMATGLSFGMGEELCLEASVQAIASKETPSHAVTRERNRENDLYCTSGGANIVTRTAMTR